MSAANDLQTAARAIRAQTPSDATFHQAVADLFDRIALSAPLVGDGPTTTMHLPPITRAAVAAAHAYLNPAGKWSAGRGAARGAAHEEARAGIAEPARAPSHDDLWQRLRNQVSA